MTAKLSQTLAEGGLGAQENSKLPTTKAGIQDSQLSSTQQALAMAAMAL